MPVLPPVSWARMSAAVETVRRRLLRAAAALDAASVPYAVVGGNAVAAWVSRVDETAVRNTRDVDLLLRRADLPAATTALEAAGFQDRRNRPLCHPSKIACHLRFTCCQRCSDLIINLGLLPIIALWHLPAYCRDMGRRSAPLTPRKTIINGGQVRWEIRIPKELRKQEGGMRRYFVKQAEAQGFCNRLASDARNYSDKARGLSDAQKIEAQEAFARLSEVPCARLADAIDLSLTHLAQKTRSVTLEELGLRLVEERRALGGRGAEDRTLAEIEERWGRFARAFPARLVSSITPEDVHDWLIGLTNARTGEPLSLDTRHGYHRVLHTVFSFAGNHVRRWVSGNPVAAVELPQAKRDRVSLLSPEDTATFLNAGVPEIRPFLAICAFAGARPDQAACILWNQIHLDRREIEIPAGSDKTDRERIVPIQPNLAVWLEQVPPAMRIGPIFHSRAFFERAVGDAKIGPWQPDVLRHGYGTYRFKIIHSFGILADEMGNSEKVIRERYFRSVSRTTADAYFAIMPPPLPTGYTHLPKLSRWTMAPALAARVIP